jgi:hypothetical protein
MDFLGKKYINFIPELKEARKNLSTAKPSNCSIVCQVNMLGITFLERRPKLAMVKVLASKRKKSMTVRENVTRVEEAFLGNTRKSFSVLPDSGNILRRDSTAETYTLSRKRGRLFGCSDQRMPLPSYDNTITENAEKDIRENFLFMT